MTNEQLEGALDEHRTEIEDLKSSLSKALQGKIELTLEISHARRERDAAQILVSQLRAKLLRTQDILEKVRMGLER